MSQNRRKRSRNRNRATTTDVKGQTPQKAHQRRNEPKADPVEFWGEPAALPDPRAIAEYDPKAVVRSLGRVRSRHETAAELVLLGLRAGRRARRAWPPQGPPSVSPTTSDGVIEPLASSSWLKIETDSFGCDPCTRSLRSNAQLAHADLIDAAHRRDLFRECRFLESRRIWESQRTSSPTAGHSSMPTLSGCRIGSALFAMSTA